MCPKCDVGLEFITLLWGEQLDLNINQTEMSCKKGTKRIGIWTDANNFVFKIARQLESIKINIGKKSVEGKLFSTFPSHNHDNKPEWFKKLIILLNQRRKKMQGWVKKQTNSYMPFQYLLWEPFCNNESESWDSLSGRWCQGNDFLFRNVILNVCSFAVPRRA